MASELSLIVNHLIMFIKEQTLNRAEIFGSSRLEDLGLDTLGLMEVVIMLEDRYAISITEEESAKAQTVEDLANLVLESQIQI